MMPLNTQSQFTSDILILYSGAIAYTNRQIITAEIIIFIKKGKICISQQQYRHHVEME